MIKDIDLILSELRNNEFWEIRFREPDAESLKQLEKKFILPEDYKYLMTKTNGFTLFGAGDYCIDKAGEIIEYTKANYFKDGVYLIGYYLGFYIIINGNEVSKDKYLYAGDACSSDEYVLIGNIVDFLNGIIDIKGEGPFWDISDEAECFNFQE